MARYLDPKADIVFKKIFADHPNILENFLNAVLPLESPIVSIEYLTPEQIPHIPILRRTIADVRCKDKTGRHFIVEMQVDWTDTFKQRLLFGTGQAFVKQLKHGEHYNLLQPVYGLGIVADTFNSHDPNWYHYYQMVRMGTSTQTKIEIIEHLQLLFLELPKSANPTDTFHEISPLCKLWMRFFRDIHEETKEAPAELFTIPEIAKAIFLCEEAAYNPAELLAYENYWDAISREKTLIFGKSATAKTEGRAEGRIEEKHENVKSFYALGVSIKIIAQATGLSEAEVKSLVEKTHSPTIPVE
jgi:predicted transposase/invertase (TIGR01784 family)